MQRPEFVLLAATLLLALAYILIAAQARTLQYGLKWGASARDEPQPPLRPVPARLQRAQANLMETLPLFVGGLLGAAAMGRLGPLTLLGGNLFFWGRLVYLPLYAAGIPYLRSLVWAVATLGAVCEVAAILVPAGTLP